MARQYHRFIRQSQNLFVNPTHQEFVVAARQVSPADASCKEYVAAEENLVIGRVEAEASRTVSGNKKNTKRDSAKFNFGCLLDEKIRMNRFCFQEKPEIFEKLRISDEGNSISVIGNLAPESLFHFRSVINMVDVTMSDQQQIESYRHICHPIRRPGRRINKNISARHLNQIGVRIENTPNKRLKVKHSE